MTSKRAGLDGLSKRSKTDPDCTVTLFVRHSASIPPKWGGVASHLYCLGNW